ncbi:MAG: helix-turn-helix transcriptional regulator [Bacillota bacterium]
MGFCNGVTMSTLRLSRLIHLLTLLRVRDGHTARSLAVELEVSERTVYRDLNALQMAGMPFSFDSESGGSRRHRRMPRRVACQPR